ncbi:MAG: hypothetical protein Q8S33_02625 [Myxococcales bacterium]|nr:hypothetical protein [Myxococcales bacterium]
MTLVDRDARLTKGRLEGFDPVALARRTVVLLQCQKQDPEPVRLLTIHRISAG